MGLQSFSDYGSGSSELFSAWSGPDTWSSFQTRLQESDNRPPSRTRSSSFIEGTSKGLDAVMQEFRMNGSDSPFDPEEEVLSYRKALMGMGPSSAYLRQKSWPAPESTPAVQLPRPDWHRPTTADMFMAATRLTETPKPEPRLEEVQVTAEQRRVLRSLPNAVLYPLLRQLEQARLPHQTRTRRQEEVECRFCKNNGERESYYRSHALRVAGRVACPVLRAFTCRRCGARGDHAHTLKYCPLTSPEERSNSAAMMRSVRLASARRRQTPSSGLQDFVMFGETTPSVIADGKAFSSQESLPLDPMWAALEQKLML